MALVRDLFKSWIGEVGADASDSAYDHFSTVAMMTTGELLRRSRGLPPGYFEKANIHLPPSMQNILDGAGDPIAVLPIGQVDPKYLVEVVRTAREVFGLEIRLLRARMPSPDTFIPKEASLDGKRLLESLYQPEFMNNHSRVLAVTEFPLKGDDIPVHGYASLQWPVGVVSTNLLGFGGKSDVTSYGNLIKITIHEIGHTFHVPHCTEPMCVMKKGPADLGTNFCVRCSSRIVDGEKPSEKTGAAGIE